MTQPFGPTTTADDVLAGVDPGNSRILITGVSSGIGLETARALAARGAAIVGTVRDVAQAGLATASIHDAASQGGGSLALIALDLASLQSVRACADKLLADGQSFDVIIANAGVMALLPLRRPAPKGERSGAFLVSLFALLAMGLGDRTQFLTAAIAARGTTPLFAAAGATLGSLAIVIPATLAGEGAYLRLPRLPIRIAIGLLFALDALWTALGALRLI